MKHKKLLITGVSLLAAAGVLGGVFAVLRLNRAPVKVIAVSNVAMTDMYFGDSQTYGTVRADNVQTIWLSETQSVTGILVQEGQEVKKGDPLLTYDTTLDGLQLQRKDLEIQEKQRSLQNAKREYNQLAGRTVYTLAAPLLPAEERQVFLALLANEESGEATEPTEATEPVVTEPSSEPSTEPAPTDPSTEPTEPTAPTETTEPEVPDYRILDGKGTAEEPYLCLLTADAPFPYEMARQFSQEDREIYVVFANTEEDQPEGLVTSAWGMRFTEEGFALFDANDYVGRPLQPLPEPDPTPSDDPIDDPGNGGMSWAELQRLLREKALEIRDLDLEIRMAQVELEKMKKELGDGTVYADTDGVVLLIGDPETAYLNGEPILKVSGGGGFYIDAQISELALDTIVPGQTVTVSSWMNGEVYEGTVDTLTDYPVENNWYGGGNQNVSYYHFTVFVDGDAMLSEGDPVDISYQSTSGGGSSFYLELPFVRTENGKSVVYLQGENGRLERRELVTGRVMDNWCVEILGGLTMEDFIAFPYGKNVTSGAKTVVAEISDFYEY